MWGRRASTSQKNEKAADVTKILNMKRKNTPQAHKKNHLKLLLLVVLRELSMNNQQEKERKDSIVFLSNVLGSASAGILARIATHPLDVSKARLQAVYQQHQHEDHHGNSTIRSSSNSSSRISHSAGRRPYRHTWDVLQRTFSTEGFRGLYRGFGAVIVGGTPGTVLYLTSYEYTKQYLSSISPLLPNNQEFLVYLLSGMIAESIACIIYVPVDVVKERLQVQHPEMHTNRCYRNSSHAFREIMKHEGWRGIYKGYAATLGSFGPFSALYFVFYEKLKYWNRLDVMSLNSSKEDLEDVELSMGRLVVCSSGAGALASFLTSPLDMAKLRLQVERGLMYQQQNTSLASSTSSNSRPPLKGVFDCLQRAYAEGGLRGLFRGAGARVLHFAPATTVTMTSFEMCRSFFANELDAAIYR